VIAVTVGNGNLGMQNRHGGLPDPRAGELRALDALIAEVSADFISLHCEQIDAAIRSAQQRVCECVGCQRSALWETSATTAGAMELTQLYQSHQPAGVPPIPAKSQVPISTISDREASPEYARLHAEQVFPWITAQVRQRFSVAISRMSDLPPEAERDRGFLETYGTKSTLVVPLWSGEVFLGALSFATLDAERSWPPETVHRLQVAGRVFADAIARRRFEVALRRSEERLSLAADYAEARPWEIDLKTEIIWTTLKTRETYGLAPGEDLTLERVLSSVHPEDREPVLRSIRETGRSGGELKVDYRIVNGAGETRWMAGRGRACRNPDGEVQSITGISVDITERKRMEEELQSGLRQIEALKRQLEDENRYLREELRSEQGHEQIVGESRAIQTSLLRSRQVAGTDATVLLLGETGTGKGMLADAIHRMSGRRERPMVTVNCASLPANLIESELFGREKGAYTGANARGAGRFEVADGGTIFLDEIGEMPLELQPKLLRVLQDGDFERLGSSRTLKVNVRVIAATGRDLKEDVRHGRFRQDLFYRLNVFPIMVPPLRERTEDIPLLAGYFAQKHARKLGKRVDSISDDTIAMLSGYEWPGNVRELEHVIERAVIIATEPVLRISETLSSVPIPPRAVDKELDAVEREHIQRVLAETRWRIEGPSGAAAILNLNPSTLRFRMKKLGVRRPA
jgi:formate hydrogenlyase transcriptional activator